MQKIDYEFKLIGIVIKDKPKPFAMQHEIFRHFSPLS